jgi:hypothetical protein
LCCNVFDIEPLAKAAHSWCGSYDRELGCTIYLTRPSVCRLFKCRWLLDESLDEDWQPNRCGFVLSEPSAAGLWVTTDRDRPLSWRGEPYFSQIKRWSQVARTGKGYVAVRSAERLFVIFPEEEVEIDRSQEMAAMKVGYRQQGPFSRPLVNVRRKDGSVTEHLGSPFFSLPS